ncbi:hypothetical protein DAPPUDRAFT_336531 [Daphnia pulex]|uniref:Uncharacterized protein n=1 Tax=Daphnia pulex TaxID=6669 RepID=E9HZV4_DAPPU|nr:hypothetical protein DAPPUDRAFT_336531 [Daphnia pulex]|eukprot:EFX62726.1 hypothetical protein DAPPUDRAFT_336531 [Daphnia pulex]
MENFYDQVEVLYKKYDFTDDGIFNINETNDPTVLDSEKVIVETGTHLVYSKKVSERGINVTMFPMVSSSGKLYPGVLYSQE